MTAGQVSSSNYSPVQEGGGGTSSSSSRRMKKTVKLLLLLLLRLLPGRRHRGAAALAGLAGTTAALSLIILALTPHPGGVGGGGIDPRGVGEGGGPAAGGMIMPPHGRHHRKIHHQEEGALASASNAALASASAPGDPRRTEGAGNGSLGGKGGEDDLHHHLLLLPEIKKEVKKEEVKEEVAAIAVKASKKVTVKEEAEEEDSSEDRQILGKAREAAIAALQHGFKLTEGQKRLLERMTPTERLEAETKVSKIRALQEKAYLQQLRAKGQVRPRRMGGGEEVVSTPQQPVRFPAALKKVHPRDWPPQYAIFLNLTHYPWPKSPGCANYSIRFAPPGSLPPLALASFPSSGNTWIRYLVEGATGLFTGSLYDDTSLTKKGMYGEAIVYDSGMTILQKTHGYTTGEAMKLSHRERLPLNHLEQFGRRGVVVVRNPFKALISHRHLDTGGHTGYAPKAHFLGKGWAEFVGLKARLWRDFYVDWLTAPSEDEKEEEGSRLHLTFYEKVREDPVGEMRRILAYLGLPGDEGRLACVGAHSDGLFKRRPSKNLHLLQQQQSPLGGPSGGASASFDPFTTTGGDLKEAVYGAVDDVLAALRGRRRKGQGQEGQEEEEEEGLPLHLYEFYDPREAEEVRRRRRSRRRSEKARSEENGVS